MLITKGLEV